MEIRELKATDMGAVCKIISSIGIRQFKDCFNVDDLKGGNVEQIGVGIAFDMVGIIMENIEKAQIHIDEFLASLTGQEVSDIQEMSLADYSKLIYDIVTRDEFKDFFKLAMKLFNQ